MTDNMERAQVGWGFWGWWVLAAPWALGVGKFSAYSPFARWRIKLLHHKPRDALPGGGGWTIWPEQLCGGLHELDLRSVFGLVEPQEPDDVFVRDRSFHRTLSLVPE